MKNSIMRKLLQLFITTIPFIVSFSTTDPTLAIQFLVLSILICGILLYYLFTNKSIYKEVIMHPAMVFFGLVLLTNICSAFYNGFGSQSIYVTLKLFLLYVLAIILVQFVIVKGYKSLLTSFIYCSLFLSAMYFFQIIVNYSDIISIELAAERNHEFNKIASTMGNKNLLSSIQFLMLPILIYLFIVSKKLIKILSSIALVLILITFFHTQTKAVFLALAIFCVSMLIMNKTKINKKYIVGLFISILLFLVSGYALMKYTNRYDAFVFEINKTLDYTSSERYKLYNSSIKLIKEHPLIGVGPGNWSVNIGKYGLYEGALGKSFAQRPHNDFLWVFSEAGIVAGISYILLFLILLRDSYYLHKNRKEKDGIFYSLLHSCFLGYAFISLVDFPMERFSHNIIFFVLVSFVVSGRIKEAKTKIATWFKLPLLVISIFAIYVASIRYKGEIHAANAIHFKEKGNWDHVIKSIDKSYNKNYYEIENTSTPLLWYRGLANFNQQRYDLATQDFKAAYELNPNHLHVINNLATCYGYNNNYTKSKELYEECISISSKFEEAALNLAAIYSYEERDEEALDILLGTRNFRVENSSHLSKNYIRHFIAIFKKLHKKCNTKEKHSDSTTTKILFFNQIKKIYLMRKQNIPYCNIIKTIHL